LLKSLFALPKTFFDKSMARSRRLQNSPPSADQTVAIASLPLRQDLLAKNVLMTTQRDFLFGLLNLLSKITHTNE
jgi:hypothetical protein